MIGGIQLFELVILHIRSNKTNIFQVLIVLK
jgi:hypothetical protein